MRALGFWAVLFKKDDWTSQMSYNCRHNPDSAAGLCQFKHPQLGLCEPRHTSELQLCSVHLLVLRSPSSPLPRILTQGNQLPLRHQARCVPVSWRTKSYLNQAKAALPRCCAIEQSRGRAADICERNPGCVRRWLQGDVHMVLYMVLYMCLCTHLSTCLYTVCTHVCTHVCAHACSIHTSICICPYLCIGTRPICMSVHICMHMSVRSVARMCAAMHAACTCSAYTCTRMRAHEHARTHARTRRHAMRCTRTRTCARRSGAAAAHCVVRSSVAGLRANDCHLFLYNYNIFPSTSTSVH